MNADATVSEVVVDELKKQARDAGYVVFAMPRTEFLLYVMYAMGVLVGWMIASRQ